ncbi:MAG: GNAT family N-acetyltransferase [Gammaproteobacteria bacterium]|nr:GNAT family N-acetyltransferase [Gammaproteobacteria bacterium]
MIELRLAKAGDADTVLSWRNDPHTVAMSVGSAVISKADHERWFARILDDPLTTLYLASADGADIGVCRFDLDPRSEQAEVSINLNPAMRGKGLALPLLEAAIAAYRLDKPVPLTATIKNGNGPSLRIFARCGFARVRTAGDCSYFVKPVV